MPSTLVRGKYVLCGVNDRDAIELISDGAVFQKDGEIVAVGAYQEVKAHHAADEEVGSDEFIVLPGLVNAHQHGRGVSHILKGVPDVNLESWLIRLMECRPVDPYLDTMYCSARQIESGVTTVVHSHPPGSPRYEEEVTATLQAYRDAGIRVAFALGIWDQNSIVYQDDAEFLRSLPPGLARRAGKHLESARISEEQYFDLFARLFEEYHNSRVRIFHGPFAPQWCSDDLLVRVRQSADKYETGIHAHTLETVYQKVYALRRYGKSFVEHLQDIGFLGQRLSLAHCVWLTENDIGLMARSGTTVCHNPSSNLRLGSGIAPVVRMLAAGVNVALGMDGTTINSDEDMFQELRLCANLQHHAAWGPPAPTPAQLLRMVTSAGASAALFPEQVGTLEKGKRADIVLVSLKNILKPYLDPEVSIVSALLGRGKAADVDTVMIDGEIVLRGGRHTRIDRDGIVAGLREAFERGRRAADAERKRLSRDLQPHISEFYRTWKPEKVEPYYLYNSRL